MGQDFNKEMDRYLIKKKGGLFFGLKPKIRNEGGDSDKAVTNTAVNIKAVTNTAVNNKDTTNKAVINKTINMEERIILLKEKQRIEEERLAELRKARKIEQVGALGVKVKNILFKEKEHPKKSFFSNFIEIKTAEEIAKEEEEREKVSEKEALNGQLAISQLLQSESRVVSNAVQDEGDTSISSLGLFPEEHPAEQIQGENSLNQRTLNQNSEDIGEDVIELDGNYRIRVIRR